MKYLVFMCRTIKVLISSWPRTRKFSQLLQAGKTVAFDFSLYGYAVGHALVTLYVQFLCSDWSQFDRWLNAENLCSILNLVYLTAEADRKGDRILCQLVMFVTIFFHWMYKMKFSCNQEFLLFMASLFIGFLVESKSEIRFRMASFSFSSG